MSVNALVKRKSLTRDEIIILFLDCWLLKLALRRKFAGKQPGLERVENGLGAMFAVNADGFAHGEVQRLRPQ